MVAKRRPVIPGLEADEALGLVVQGWLGKCLSVVGLLGKAHFALARRKKVRGLLLSPSTTLSKDSLQLLRAFSPRELVLNNVTLPSPDLPLAELAPELEALHLASRGTFHLEGLRSLKCLGFDSSMVDAVTGLEGVLPGLWDLNLTAPSSKVMALLSREPRPELQALRASRLPMSDLEFLAALPSLRGIWLVDCRKTRTLTGIESCRDLADLCLACVRPGSLAPLRQLPRLSRVFLESCGPIASLDPLRHGAQLQQVVLRGSTQVMDGKVAWLRDEAAIPCVSVARHAKHDVKGSIRIAKGSLPPFMQYWAK